MTRFAIVINGVVDNIIVADNLDIAKTVTRQGEVIELEEGSLVGINDTHNSETGFVSIRPKPATLTKEERLAQIGNQTDNE